MDKKYLQGYASLQDDFNELPETYECDNLTDMLGEDLANKVYEAITEYLSDDSGHLVNGYNIHITINNIDWDKEE